MRAIADNTAAIDPETAALAWRLDTLIALFQIAHAPELGAARERIRADGANAAILDATESSWVQAGSLRDDVVLRTGLKQSAVRARIAELHAVGALERRGGGPTTEYRSTGIV